MSSTDSLTKKRGNFKLVMGSCRKKWEISLKVQGNSKMLEHNWTGFLR